MSEWTMLNKVTGETRELGKYIITIIDEHDGNQTYYCEEDGVPFSSNERRIAEHVCEELSLELTEMKYCEVQTLV